MENDGAIDRLAERTLAQRVQESTLRRYLHGDFRQMLRRSVQQC
jgi:hypothetical protein